MTSNETIAFGRPGGEAGTPSRARPIDLVHLARQTMGDRAVEQEVLAMFAQQLCSVRGRLAAADPTERKHLAHTLKGAARGVGAFAVGDCAERIEADPADGDAMALLSTLIDEAKDFIAAVTR